MSTTRAIALPIRKVTVLEDRAQVRRAGTISLAAGSTRLVVENVSPVVADRTLVARLAADAGRVDEVKVVREWRVGHEEKPSEAAALAREREALESELRDLGARHERLERKRAMLERASDLVVDGIQREMPFSPAFEPRWKEDLRALVAGLEELDGLLLASAAAVQEAGSRQAALDLRSAAAARPDDVLATRLEIDVTSGADGEVELTVDYLVPCALWRPIHRASLARDHVRFEGEGAVWQRTGEDWIDVDLSFSTARPTQRAVPPTLSEDVLRVRRKVEKKIVVAVREQTIRTTGEGAAAASTPLTESLRDSNAAATTSELPGVDDGGETRVMPAASKATIPADGALRRVPIFAFEGPADVDHLARPERSPLVHRRSRFVNGAAHPLLAGPVELYADGAFVGRAEVPFVAPGERLVLGWGGDADLRVQRRSEEHRETAKLTGRQTISRKVELSVSNLAAEPRAFTLEERVPVSELEDVTIEVLRKECSPPPVVDAQGIAGFSVSLSPLGTQKVVLAYRISAGSDVHGL